MPAKSQAQQRFMGMVHAEKEGTLDKSKLDPEFAAKIEAIAKRIKAKKAEEFAETKHKGLPKTAATWTSVETVNGKKVLMEHSNKPIKGGLQPRKDEKYWKKAVNVLKNTYPSPPEGNSQGQKIAAVNEAGNYTHPTMRKKLFKKILASNKGGKSGQ